MAIAALILAIIALLVAINSDYYNSSFVGRNNWRVQERAFRDIHPGQSFLFYRDDPICRTYRRSDSGRAVNIMTGEQIDVHDSCIVHRLTLAQWPESRRRIYS